MLEWTEESLSVKKSSSEDEAEKREKELAAANLAEDYKLGPLD